MMYSAALARGVVDMAGSSPCGCRWVYGSDCGRFAVRVAVIVGFQMSMCRYDSSLSLVVLIVIVWVPNEGK